MTLLIMHWFWKSAV